LRMALERRVAMDDDLERSHEGPAPLSGVACLCVGVGFVLLLVVGLLGVRYLGG